MPRTCSNIEKIRAELAWVNEAVDPTCAVAGIFSAVSKPHMLSENVRVLLPEDVEFSARVFLF
jgi:hypothetical protein